MKRKNKPQVIKKKKKKRDVRNIIRELSIFRTRIIYSNTI